MRHNLSWTHYRLLMRIQNDDARAFYQNETIVRYSMLEGSRQLFASKYMLYLPTEKELSKELKREIEEIKLLKHLEEEEE